jgi:MFS family permease
MSELTAKLYTGINGNTALQPSPPKKFYGWWIVFAGTAVLFVSSGIGFYGHGVILDPLRAQYGWTKGTISSAVTLYFLVAGVMGMLIGPRVDKYGAKPVLILGSVILGLGLVLLSLISELWQLYAVYFLMSIGWSGTSLVTINTLIANWFIRKRGLAMGLTMTGMSVGGMILVPFAIFLTNGWGLKIALPVLGATHCIVVIPVTLFVVRRRPSDVGQAPDGEPPAPSAEDEPAHPLSFASQMRVWTRRQAMGTIAFWAIVVAFLLALGAQIAFLMHQVSFLGQFLGPSGAASAVSITTGASIAGRLFLGWIADRYNKRYQAMACFLIQGSALLFLAYSSHVVILYLGTFAFGLTMGGMIMMQSLIIGECFGLVSYGTVSGWAGLFTIAGAALGPTLAGIIYDATQSYQGAFNIFAVVSLVASISILFARPPKPETAAVE